MKKEHPVVMLPSKTGSLTLHNDGKLYYFDFVVNDPINQVCQHLYILSQEEIKEGDWFITNSISGILKQAVSIQSYQGTKYTIDSLGNEDNVFWSRKIIATTDPNLLAYTGHESYNPCFRMPLSFLPIYVDAYNKQKPIEMVELEYQDYDVKGRITDEEHIDNLGKYFLKLNPDNTVNISLKEERMFTESDMKSLISEFRQKLGIEGNGNIIYIHKVAGYSRLHNVETERIFKEWLSKNYPS